VRQKDSQQLGGLLDLAEVEVEPREQRHTVFVAGLLAHLLLQHLQGALQKLIRESSSRGLQDYVGLVVEQESVRT
jgi:hypothetical protein